MFIIIYYSHLVVRDDTKRRASGRGGLCCQMKNMNFPRVGELHRRAGRQAAPQDGQVGCTLSWAAEKDGPEVCPFLQLIPPFSAARRTAFLCSPPARPSVLCAAARQPAENSPFWISIWKHGPPARPALQLVLSVVRYGHFELDYSSELHS